MRILKLSFEAVGSFGGKETIDFTKLGTGSGLFLIHGPTGSGKSTILDAIVSPSIVMWPWNLTPQKAGYAPITLVTTKSVGCS